MAEGVGWPKPARKKTENFPETSLVPTESIQAAASAYAYPLLIKQLLHTPLATAADQEIVYRDSHRQTYRDLAARIRRLANALRDAGIGPGDTVAVMDWDSHRYLECFFAVPMMGAVLQTVNVRLSPEQILYTLNHAGADIVLVNADFIPVLAGIKGQLETVKRFVLISDTGNDMAMWQIPFVGEYEALLAKASSEYDFPDFDENTRATTFYTTGTTGLPKGVYFSHRQLVLHTLAVATHLGTAEGQCRLHRGDVYMPITPMFHVHAWGVPYIATLLGLKQVYPGRYAPETLARYVRDEKVTFSHCVPTILQMLLTNAEAKAVDLKGWKVIIGGSALPKGLATAALERGIDVFTGYGMSETCPILTIARAPGDVPAEDLDGQAEQRIRTGYPVPLVDLHTVDSDLLDTPRDGKSSGEIVVRAPWLTMGYLHNPSTSDELWAGGYLHTGDIGVIDPAGCLQVTDRLKDVIKTGGEWVSSLELENIISQHPAVSEVAVVGVKDDKWGERPLAMVVLKPGQTATADEIKVVVAKFAEAGHISRYAVPDEIRFVEALARTSVGKINKKAIREDLA
ncbi:MAG: fatty acid--CoA ligase [Thauera phenolivorans]|uniref:Fatty acid--CoA ligase n=1 Tax=Thauera phenolivorans TaxID=1792543 RepID=A0A7X7LV59_9RHOO|nr:fatty acid--CoA ligase [Thauera phenolivorans]